MAHVKASIDFGLVHIPIELVSAEDRSEHVSFHMLDSRDKSRIRLKRINENTGREVEWDDIVKGYEVSKGRYVTFTEEELDALESESNKSLEIDAFIDKDEIGPEMFESPYIVVPGKGGEKGYSILQEVLERSEKFAVVQAVLRTREQLGVLYGRDGALMLGFLRYPDELKKPSDVLPPSILKKKVSAREVSMAEKLLEQMSSSFKAAKYKDNYATKLRAAIKRKSSSKKGRIAAAPQKRAKGKTVDILELLEKSIRSGGARGKSGKKRRAA